VKAQCHSDSARFLTPSVSEGTSARRVRLAEFIPTKEGLAVRKLSAHPTRNDADAELNGIGPTITVNLT